jgi:hypothetical protein
VGAGLIHRHHEVWTCADGCGGYCRVDASVRAVGACGGCGRGRGLAGGCVGINNAALRCAVEMTRWDDEMG